MYLLQLHFTNAKANGCGSFVVPQHRGSIGKWSVLDSGAKGSELIRLIGLACGGIPFVSQVRMEARKLGSDQAAPLDVAFVMARHAPKDGRSRSSPVLGSGLRLTSDFQTKRLLRPELPCLSPDLTVCKPPLGNGNSAFFCLGYGPTPVPKRHEDFDFEDPLHRATRFLSLFRPDAPITNPVAFLSRLQYKAVRAARFPAQQTVRQLTELFATHLGIDIAAWWSKTARIQEAWGQMKAWQQRIVLPILDAVRHAMDASPRLGHPLTAPGVVLLHRPDRLCPENIFPAWIELFNSLLPNMQFFVTLSTRATRQFPPHLRRLRLNLPETPHAKERKPPCRIPAGGILLVDVDGRLPNVALMKLSQFFKARGQSVQLARGDSPVAACDEVWASCVFHNPASLRRVGRLWNQYRDRLHVGGSGVNLTLRLPPGVESLEADYRLYPELGDRAIGFLTRGCPFRCPFCIVPRKEGPPRQVTDLASLLQGRTKLVLLDDNLLAHPQAADFLEEMVQRKIQVNFNQTLDILLLNEEKAGLLRRIRCRDVDFQRDTFHFSLNNTDRLDAVARRYRQLDFRQGDNVEFVCMYGFNTTLEEDLERFRLLKSLPGAYVFVQEYRPFPGAPPPKLGRFFDARADQLIDELVRIIFTQNMKSLEKYYRWLSRQYALTFGKLHKGLVDTLFRYNNRHAKGRYLATLAGTKGSVPCIDTFSAL